MSRSDARRAARYGPPREAGHKAPPYDNVGVPLARLAPGTAGRVVRVGRDLTGRADRLAALGVTPGARVRVLQTFPGLVFECDQTELAVERVVAGTIFVHVEE
jgi:DtxR family transcriptional regulator, Mn-dependent transcriptional regulator